MELEGLDAWGIRRGGGWFIAMIYKEVWWLVDVREVVDSVFFYLVLI